MDRNMPNVTQPLDKWAEDRLLAALQRHTLWCMEHGPGAEVSRVKLRFAALVAFMAGSGILGGGIGAAVTAAILKGTP